jgi:hypothetical protein
VGFEIFGKRLKSGAIIWKWENEPFVGNAASLVLTGNISLTINIALSDTVTEYSAVVRIQ